MDFFTLVLTTKLDLTTQKEEVQSFNIVVGVIHIKFLQTF